MKFIFWALIFLIPNLLYSFDFTKLKTEKAIYNAVNKGLDPNTKSENGFTLLHHASHFSDPKLITFLIKKGAKTDASDKRNDTPFSIAASYGSAPMMKAFLDAGADPNLKLSGNFYDKTIFHYMITKMLRLDEQTIEMFLIKGSKIEEKDKYGNTVLISAADFEYNRSPIAMYLVKKGALINAQNIHGVTPLMVATRIQNVELSKFLIQSGADVNLKDRNGNNALFNLINAGNFDDYKIEIANYLVDAKTNLNNQNNDGYTILHEAMNAKKHQLLKLFIEKGADTSLKNKKNKTALAQAIINSNMDAVKMLLAYEKNINQLDEYGSTMLHSAILNDRFDLMKLLLDAGADKKTKDKWGKDAFEFAKVTKKDKALEMLGVE